MLVFTPIIIHVPICTCVYMYESFLLACVPIKPLPCCTHHKWNPFNKDTIGTLLSVSVPNRGVSLIQGLFYTCSYVAGTADGVL